VLPPQPPSGWSHRLAARTPASHVGNGGSIPPGTTLPHSRCSSKRGRSIGEHDGCAAAMPAKRVAGSCEHAINLTPVVSADTLVFAFRVGASRQLHGASRGGGEERRCK